ncbi:MAG: hypothetical protein HY343_13610 [Lentisphaerae bacterium]|nr:hypothetical protein [Lentisphaerota bacterium]
MIAVRQAKRWLEQRDAERHVRLEKRWTEARDDAERLIRHIVENYRPRRVWQWGSVLRKERFSDISDIDIAVEGLPSVEDYFRLLGECQAMTTYAIDVVEIERIEPAFADLIRAQGVLRHERQ